MREVGLWVGNLDAGRRGQTVPHRAEPARSHPVVMLVEFEELSGPHLMLADLGGDVHVALAGQRVEAFDRILRLDQVVPGPVAAQTVVGLPALDLPPPFGGY